MASTNTAAGKRAHLPHRAHLAQRTCTTGRWRQPQWLEAVCRCSLGLLSHTPAPCLRLTGPQTLAEENDPPAARHSPHVTACSLYKLDVVAWVNHTACESQVNWHILGLVACPHALSGVAMAVQSEAHSPLCDFVSETHHIKCGKHAFSSFIGDLFHFCWNRTIFIGLDATLCHAPHCQETISRRFRAAAHEH